MADAQVTKNLVVPFSVRDFGDQTQIVNEILQVLFQALETEGVSEATLLKLWDREMLWRFIQVLLGENIELKEDQILLLRTMTDQMVKRDLALLPMVLMVAFSMAAQGQTKTALFDLRHQTDRIKIAINYLQGARPGLVLAENEYLIYVNYEREWNTGVLNTLFRKWPVEIVRPVEARDESSFRPKVQESGEKVFKLYWPRTQILFQETVRAQNDLGYVPASWKESFAYIEYVQHGLRRGQKRPFISMVVPGEFLRYPKPYPGTGRQPILTIKDISRSKPGSPIPHEAMLELCLHDNLVLVPSYALLFLKKGLFFNGEEI